VKRNSKPTGIKIYSHFINKILVFYKPDIATYWHTITPCTIKNKPLELDRYYLDFSSKFNFPGIIDDAGIPIYEFPNKRRIYHPIVICQYALGIFEKLYLSGYKEGKLKQKFMIQADWLLEKGTDTSKGFVWYLDFNIEEYGLYPPWFSALSQGEAISVLTRAYKISNNTDYLTICEKAIIPFSMSVDSGGLVNIFNRIPIYEEYPSPKKTVAVLNGFMFSLFGLYDLYLANNNSQAFKLFENGIDSLTKIIKYYDIGYWSRYYLFDYPKKYNASYTYHNIMINQLMALYYISGNEVLKEYSIKWEKYKNNNINKTRALLNKLFYARKLKV
jgi:heparosan-N-sulfate-glucuronate 5-epimerase